LKRAVFTLLFIAILSLPIFAAGEREAETPSGPSLVAATTWTEAFLRAAGVEGPIQTLAPADYRHPPEYELAPSQALLLSRADYFIFAGYEGISMRIKDGSLKTGGRQIQIATVNSLEVFRESITKLAQEFGTQEQAEKNLLALENQVAGIREEIRAAGFFGAPVVCHAFLKDMVQDFGFTVAGVFGPAPPEAGQLVKLAESRPVLIIDNWHNDVGQTVTRTLKDVPSVSFINFPGHGETETLADVLEYNRQQLLEVLKKR